MTDPITVSGNRGLLHRFTKILSREGINHRVLVFASPMSPAPVVLDDPLDFATRLIMQSRVCEGLFTFVARELDAREQAEGLRVVQGIKGPRNDA